MRGIEIAAALVSVWILLLWPYFYMCHKSYKEHDWDDEELILK